MYIAFTFVIYGRWGFDSLHAYYVWHSITTSLFHVHTSMRVATLRFVICDLAVLNQVYLMQFKIDR